MTRTSLVPNQILRNRLVETREPGRVMEHYGCTVIYVTDPRDLWELRCIAFLL
jgi:hypothetical protein